MDRVIVFLALIAFALVAAWILNRRKPDRPSAPSFRVPKLLDRNDFSHLDKPVLVVVFTSKDCEACGQAWQVASQFESDNVGLQKVELANNTKLAERYKIDGVPTTLVVGSEGVVESTFFGPIDPKNLEQAISEVDS